MNPVLGKFTVPGTGATAGTAFSRLIPPYPGPSGNPPFIYSVNNSVPNWQSQGSAFTTVKRLEYLTGTTQHTLYVMRPLNWTTVNGAVAANATSIILTADPGVYSTKYRYGTSLGYVYGTQTVASTANNAIAGSDWVACQLVDGSWYYSIVSSVSSLTLTVTTAVPNVSGGGIADGTPIFFFGTTTDTDPATGQPHPSWATEPAGSGQTTQVFSDPDGIVSSVHAGDPMIFYSANATARGDLGLISGTYTKF
jgi:hypothetical protein